MELPEKVEQITVVKPSEKPVEVVKPTVTTSRRRRSGLSLKSLKIESNAAAKKEETPTFENTKSLPETTFSDEELQVHWKSYIDILISHGEKIIASIINTDLPKAEGSIIKITLPNEMMKVEILRHQSKLLAHLKENLNNYHLKLDVAVNEQSAKKLAYTPLDKYKKLREKNSLLDKLKAKFDLDL